MRMHMDSYCAISRSGYEALFGNTEIHSGLRFGLCFGGAGADQRNALPQPNNTAKLFQFVFNKAYAADREHLVQSLKGTMKLLLDENLSRRLVPQLQAHYLGSSQVVLLGIESATDKGVWQKANNDGYVIVTRDADFQELSLVWGHPPKVIRLKTFNQSREATLTPAPHDPGPARLTSINPASVSAWPWGRQLWRLWLGVEWLAGRQRARTASSRKACPPRSTSSQDSPPCPKSWILWKRRRSVSSGP